MDFDPIFLEFIRPLIERQKENDLSLAGVPGDILRLFWAKRYLNVNGSLTREGIEAYQKYEREKTQNSGADRCKTIHSNIKTA